MAPDDAPPAGDRFFPADLIRALATILVILVHTSGPLIGGLGPGEQMRWWTANVCGSIARISVPLFVLLSGALLLRSPGTDALGPFLRRRLMRIVPPFLFWSPAYFAWRHYVEHDAVTFSTVWRNLVEGMPYVHFWFIYVAIGLVLLAPMLRLIVVHASPAVMGWFIGLWFFGVACRPMIARFDHVTLAGGAFQLAGWVGCFVLGACLPRVRLPRRLLGAAAIAGTAVTIVGTWRVTLSAGKFDWFFCEFLSPNVLLTASAVFLLLWHSPGERIERSFPRGAWLVRRIARDSLGIYLMHLVLTEGLRKGTFGFKLTVSTWYPILQIPATILAALAICLLILAVLKRIPVLRRCVG